MHPVAAKVTRRTPGSASSRRRLHDRSGIGAAFTLLELMVVVGIIGILAGLALPSMKKNKGNVLSAATRQVLDDLALARLRAINSRTTVYVVFFPAQSYYNFNAAQRNYFLTNQSANQIIGSQFTTYALFTRHSIGDQPGTDRERYLTEWKTLPEGVFFPEGAFQDPTTYLSWSGAQTFPIPGTSPASPAVGGIPLRTNLHYVAFDSQGRVEGRTADVRVPLTVGSVFIYKDTVTSRTNLMQDPDVFETPPGNWTNNPNYIRINWLTGRCKVERLELP